MNYRALLHTTVALCAIPCGFAPAAAASLDPASRTLAHDIFKELIEINTTDSVGSTTLAAEAVQRRLLAAGFRPEDVTVLGPARKGNLVARYHGKAASKLKPVLILGHLDVVEARPEDWTTDPFKFVEKDGYYYGRGTQDMKVSDAIVVADLIRLKKEGFVPDRDIILALTAAEEGGTDNGASWLVKEHRNLIDAEFVLNPDSGGIVLDHGKPQTMEFEATEKLYADYQIVATNPGGHSSLPKPDNAIYHVVDALAILQKSPFPVELNTVTREYFTQVAKTESPAVAADIRAVLATPSDAAAAERLSKDARYNSTLRTTCVATMLNAGHATNALPQHAEANVNCRIFPGYSQEDIRLALIKLFQDPSLTIRYRSDAGELLDHGSDRKSLAPPPLRPELMASLNEITHKYWPGVPVIPIMMVGATDSVYTMMAGMPSYGVCGIALERDDVRAHGRDERMPVESFYTGVEFYYDFIKSLTGRKH